MLPVSESHFSTVLYPKENLSFFIYGTQKTLCKLFEKYTVEELDTVNRHFV